jgi:hypothetical protein
VSQLSVIVSQMYVKECLLNRVDHFRMAQLTTRDDALPISEQAEYALIVSGAASAC